MASKTLDERLIPSIQYVTPTTGGTVNVNASGHVRLLVNPALTISGGTVLGALTAFAVGSFATYIFNTTSSQWYRVG